MTHRAQRTSLLFLLCFHSPVSIIKNILLKLFLLISVVKLYLFCASCNRIIVSRIRVCVCVCVCVCLWISIRWICNQELKQAFYERLCSLSEVPQCTVIVRNNESIFEFGRKRTEVFTHISNSHKDSRGCRI